MSSVALDNFLCFWGKAQPSWGQGPRWHPVAHHLLDVAAVARVLLDERTVVAQRIAYLLTISTADARRLISALAGLHDLGKFAPAFQAKAPEHWPTGVLGAYRPEYAVRRPHTEDGYVLWDGALAATYASRIWIGGADVLSVLAPSVFGHHGRPVGAGYGRDGASLRFRAGLAPAVACADAILTLLLPAPIESPTPSEECVRLASWLVSGILTVADWVGSNERWFPYAKPDVSDASLLGYWDRACRQAARAVRDAGLIPSKPSAPTVFAEVAQVSGDATPVQKWASTVALPGGPSLMLVEDVTGSGKTEAAQMLVHRLMSAGRATGAYWAMPTMATANAMFARQGRIIGALFSRHDGEGRPSLVLAHGQQRLNEAFRRTVLGVAGEPPPSGAGVEGDMESSVACAAFLADDRRAALLADVGAGTVDQAILAALPSRFNTIRLLGLADKVLVLDEVHAYDRYMLVEIHELLRFQAALGGSAIVLSATLPMEHRRHLVQAWSDGAQGGGRYAIFGGGVELTSSSYPLATVVSAELGVQETALDAAPWSHRRVSVTLVHDLDSALQHVMDASASGGAVAWVRNTVDDCLSAANRLRERGIEPLIFHARFAQVDRQAREIEVMRLFGKTARAEDRRGRVLVATQVIEQSLDLDFDAMVSDLAPIDLLVQRAGRLWRHSARTSEGRPTVLQMELVVLSPEPNLEPPADWLGGVFKGTAYVYEDAGTLWRTVQTLADVKCIATPEGLRDLIERVYASDEVPTSLLPVTQRSEGKQSAHAATANYAVLKAPDGYHADAVAWVSDMRVPTRLSDPTTMLRLARVRADGMLEPWASAEERPWKAWALSEVSVRAYRVPAGSLAQPRYIDAIARLRAGWGRFEQEIAVLPLEQSSADAWTGSLVTADGTTKRFRYDTEVGLLFSTEVESQHR